MQGISIKGTAGVVGGVISSVLWSILSAFVHAVKVLPADQLTMVEGATALVVGVLLFYFVPESALPPIDVGGASSGGAAS